MDKDTERILKKAERIFAALDKGDKSRRRYTQLAELQRELDALKVVLDQLAELAAAE